MYRGPAQLIDAQGVVFNTVARLTKQQNPHGLWDWWGTFTGGRTLPLVEYTLRLPSGREGRVILTNIGSLACSGGDLPPF